MADHMLASVISARRLQRVAATLVAGKARIASQRVEVPYDLAPVPADEHRHQCLEGFRAVGKRRVKRWKASAFEARGFRHLLFEPCRAAEGAR